MLQQAANTKYNIFATGVAEDGCIRKILIIILQKKKF